MRSVILFPLIFLALSSAYNTQSTGPKDKINSDLVIGNMQPFWYGGIIQPQSREDTNLNSSASSLICGGTSMGLTHYLTSQQVPNQFKWYIRTSFPNATCLVRLSLGVNTLDDSSFWPLIPDNSHDVAADGSFPCGRQGPIVETKQFTFNSSISCDHCVLEWIWNTPYGQSRQCADVMITNGIDTPCLGMCENNGVCSNGQCVCQNGYTGAYCEKGPGINFGVGWIKVLSIIFWVLCSIILLVGTFFCLYYVAKQRVLFKQKQQIYHTNEQKYNEFDKEGPTGVQAGTLRRDT